MSQSRDLIVLYIYDIVRVVEGNTYFILILVCVKVHVVCVCVFENGASTF